MVHMGMTIMAHNAATLVRIQQNRLSKRAQKLRRLLGLKSRHFNQSRLWPFFSKPDTRENGSQMRALLKGYRRLVN
jgi:hypothetical protein